MITTGEVLVLAFVSGAVFGAAIVYAFASSRKTAPPAPTAKA